MGRMEWRMKGWEEEDIKKRGYSREIRNIEGRMKREKERWKIIVKISNGRKREERKIGRDDDIGRGRKLIKKWEIKEWKRR